MRTGSSALLAVPGLPLQLLLTFTAPCAGAPLLPSHEVSCQLFFYLFFFFFASAFCVLFGEQFGLRVSSRSSSIPAHSGRTLYRGMCNPRGYLVIDKCKNVITNHCFLQKLCLFSFWFFHFYFLIFILFKQPKPRSNIAAQSNIF